MQLADLAAMIRSKNAGPFVLTFDILFGDDESYQRVKLSGALNIEMFARLYRTDVSKVRFFECDRARAFKFSIPHPTASGSADLHGGQQFIPLLTVQIP